jgi:glycyl-tRNA synthetase beta chain
MKGGSGSRDLIYEIGTEEIPASYLIPALGGLRDTVARRLAEERLDHGTIESFATPRRFTLVVRGLAARQKDLERAATGPAVSVAFDAEGRPTAAAQGFAKSQGVPVETLERTATGKGEYVVARVRRPGLPAIEVVPAVLVEATRAMSFPRSMTWSSAELRFARPIRWLLALLGGDVIPVALDDIGAGRDTWGLRFHRPGPFRVRDASDYLRTLAENGVMLDPAERELAIRTGLQAGAREAGGRLVEDAELLHEVACLVESPSVVRGAFDRAFLELPRDVIIMAMRAHQRYFAVEESRGEPALRNTFLCVVNGPLRAGGLDLQIVRGGHERVLHARLADARFYWQRDVARGVKDRESELAGVVWQEGLGTLADKTRRLVDLGVQIARAWDPSLEPIARRAALLAKVDQVSEMVRDGKEFTALEGVIGAEYARAGGEAAEVCAAIAEQYLPRGADDRLPASLAGAALAVADKLDHVTGAFVAGKAPSGSEDPFAVRRAANGLLRILIETDRHVSLSALIRRALALLAPFLGERNSGEVEEELKEFFGQRIDAFLAERGIRYDLADATVHGSMDDPADIRHRAEALAAYSSSPDFAPLVVGYKRVANILRGPEASPIPALSPASLTEPAERELHAAAAAAAGRIREHASARRFGDALAELLALRAPIDRFFDDVMVMVEDRQVRGRRLALLAEVRELFTGTWDLSRVVLEGEKSR